jgi:hypothetical protein
LKGGGGEGGQLGRNKRRKGRQYSKGESKIKNGEGGWLWL